jgi:DNA-binding NtrC family response regulator
VPIVVMTAGYRAKAEAERHGAAAHLAKPFDLEELLATVERCLDQR